MGSTPRRDRKGEIKVSFLDHQGGGSDIKGRKRTSGGFLGYKDDSLQVEHPPSAKRRL